MGKNIGGRARGVELTLQDLGERIDRSYWAGFEHGKEIAREDLRQELEREVIDELERWDPDCPMCQLRRRAEELEHDVAASRIAGHRATSKNRGWAMREGRYKYRETGS